MKNSENQLPKIGARIVKSAVGVALCMIIYLLRGGDKGGGMPFYSALAVLWCMQQYTSSTKAMAKQRIIGTLIGAAYGLVFLIVIGLFDNLNYFAVYLATSAMIIPIIYTTVVINKRNASFFSCVVFLSIAVTHSFDENPYMFVLNRVLDTFIGIAVGVGLNVFHLPAKHDNSILYVSGIDAVLVSRHDTMIPYNKVELNRLIALGAKFTVSTVRTPASLITLMEGVNLNLPVIAMDGAVLYDIKENMYLESVPLKKDISDRAERIISETGLHCFVNVLYDNTLMIYYGELVNDAEKDLLKNLRRSPYRNYTHMSFRRNDTEKEQVIYLMVLAEDDKISCLHDALRAGDIDMEARVTLSPAAEYEGYTYLKIYSKEASKANMLKKLKERVQSEKVVTFGSVEGEYDVYIDDDGGNSAVKTLKRLYEGH